MGQKGVHAIETMCKELGINEDPEKVMVKRDEKYIELLRTKSEPMTGLLELLDFLESNNIRKAIATSSNKTWVNILLSRANILNRFDFIVTGEDVKVGKPDPEIYLKATSLLNVSANSCLVLEDAINGIRSGKAAGCMVVAVPDEHTAHQDFSEADHVVPSLADQKLKDIIIL